MVAMGKRERSEACGVDAGVAGIGAFTDPKVPIRGPGRLGAVHGKLRDDLFVVTNNCFISRRRPCKPSR